MTIIALSCVTFFILSLFFSYLFPQEKIISKNLRVPLQKTIITKTSDYVLEDTPIVNHVIKNYQLTNEATIPWEDLNKHLLSLEAGDIFFTANNKYLGSFFVPGKWKHSGIYLGNKKQAYDLLKDSPEMLNKIYPYYKNDDQILILDSNFDGVQIRELNKMLNLSSFSYLKSFLVFRINKDKSKIINFVNNGQEQIGKEYDYDLDTNNDEKLYCSELIYHALKSIGLEVSTERAYARNIITPDSLVDYMRNNANFALVVFLDKSSTKTAQSLAKNKTSDQ